MMMTIVRLYFLTAVISLLAITSPTSAKSISVDFDKAMSSVNFSLTADDNGAKGGNGIPDATEMALIATILADETLSFKDQGGIDHATVYQAWLVTSTALKKDTRWLRMVYPRVVDINGGFIMIGTKDSFNAIQKMSAAFGAPLDEDYSAALRLGPYLGPHGDADGDGYTNLQEYHAHNGKRRDAYIKAALDPNNIPTKEQLGQIAPTKDKLKTVGVVLFPGFEVMDVYGPLGIWGNIPEFNIVTVSEKAGRVQSAQGTITLAEYNFDNAPHIDILLVPGGSGARSQIKNTLLLDFIKSRHISSELTTTVCSGSALLAKTGVLNDRQATSNKYFFSFATEQSAKVNWVKQARWVEDGKIFTSSGVTAGTDMALAVVEKMFNKQRAEQLANSLEYRWNSDPHDDPFVKFIQ